MVYNVDMWQAEIRQCAPNVAPRTLSSIMKVESGGHPYVIFDNGPAHLSLSQRKPHWRSFRAQNEQEAVAWAKQLLAQGRLLDVGLMQLNSKNWSKLGLTVETVFKPCENLRAGAVILAENYARASASMGEGQRALMAAISAYNTGSFSRGAVYVSKVFKAAGAPTKSVASSPTRGPSQASVGENYQAPNTVNPFTAPAQVVLTNQTGF